MQGAGGQTELLLGIPCVARTKRGGFPLETFLPVPRVSGAVGFTVQPQEQASYPSREVPPHAETLAGNLSCPLQTGFVMVSPVLSGQILLWGRGGLFEQPIDRESPGKQEEEDPTSSPKLTATRLGQGASQQ